jgi:hypothetical protein
MNFGLTRGTQALLGVLTALVLGLFLIVTKYIVDRQKSC